MNANPAYAASAAPALDTLDIRAHATAQSLDRFDAYRVSLDACRACAPIAAQLSAALRDQLRRASASVVLSVGEGFGSYSRGIKRRHYEIACGSAIECVAIPDVASMIGIGVGSGIGVRAGNGSRDAEDARTLFTRAAMMLAKLVSRFPRTFVHPATGGDRPQARRSAQITSASP